MTQKTSDEATSGFTIIEVMIVLAIAGFILLMVFQAIPALTRNSRNNQRKQDVAAVLQVISQYELNNSGDFPPPITPGTNILANIQNKLSLYEVKTDATSQVIIVDSPAFNNIPNSVSPATDPNVVTIYNYKKCDPTTTGGATRAAAGYNDIVAIFALEGGGTSVHGVCQQL